MNGVGCAPVYFHEDHEGLSIPPLRIIYAEKAKTQHSQSYTKHLPGAQMSVDADGFLKKLIEGTAGDGHFPFPTRFFIFIVSRRQKRNERRIGIVSARKRTRLPEARSGHSPYSPEFWREYAGNRAKVAGEGYRLESCCWDRAAATYDDLEACTDYMFQMEAILASLRERRAVAQGMTVLDVACGTGSYALRMAPFCKEVTCLDISRRMLDRLDEKRARLGLKNVRAVHQDWFAFRPAETFDTVFASMTPLLHAPDTIDRMLEIAGRFVALVGWAGVRENPLLAAIVHDLTGHGHPSPPPDDILIPFNYLRALGLAPDVRFFHGCWVRTRSVERQVESFLWRLELNRPLTADEKAHVRIRTEAAAENGTVTLRTKVRIGFLLVDKGAGADPC